MQPSRWFRSADRLFSSGISLTQQGTTLARLMHGGSMNDQTMTNLDDERARPLGDTGDGETGVPNGEQGISNRGGYKAAAADDEDEDDVDDDEAEDDDEDDELDEDLDELDEEEDTGGSKTPS
jgi:hypothetical protein